MGFEERDGACTLLNACMRVVFASVTGPPRHRKQRRRSRLTDRFIVSFVVSFVVGCFIVSNFVVADAVMHHECRRQHGPTSCWNCTIVGKLLQMRSGMEHVLLTVGQTR